MSSGARARNETKNDHHRYQYLYNYNLVPPIEILPLHVKIDGRCSAYTRISRGVSQGSILGPVPFLAPISTVTDKNADDTTMSSVWNKLSSIRHKSSQNINEAELR